MSWPASYLSPQENSRPGSTPSPSLSTVAAAAGAFLPGSLAGSDHQPAAASHQAPPPHTYVDGLSRGGPPRMDHGGVGGGGVPQMGGGADGGVCVGGAGAPGTGISAPIDDDELTIPRAAMNKMLKELLPTVRIANESRELVLNCCSEFIHHIATRANEVCNQNHKKTINADHILTALDMCGFSEYREDAQRVFTDCKEVAAKRRKQSSRLEHLGVPEEELLRQQQELFARARQEQAEQAHQDWAHIQQAAMTGLPIAPDSDEDDDY